MTLGEIARAMQGELVAGDADGEPGGFSIDTRTLQRGDVFFAIRGDRFDGHAFVAQALSAGALAAVVSERPADATAGGGLIVVPDTLAGLQRLANSIRRTSGAKVVAVTGSAGKSTTKEITAELLSAKYQVFRNRGNLNNHIGLPLSLLELRHKPDVAVVELGMNHFGEIRTLVGIAEPDVRMWTNVGPAHLEFFGTVEAIAEAKAEVMEGARKNDLLVANADDDLVMRHARRFAGRVLTFGIDRSADVRAIDVRDRGIDGTSATVTTPSGRVGLTTPLPGIANLANVLAAVAVAVEFQVPLPDVARKAAELRPVAHRGEVVRARGVTIIDDSYNSNPKALARAIATIAGETRYARRIAVVGEMLELGAASADLHKQAGREAAASALHAVIAVGEAPARAFADGAIEGGMPAANVHYVADSRQAADLAASIVREGDLVLVKGSRGIKTELVVERLKGERG